MRVFCTGASGYIGGSVAAHLIAAGHQVTGLVRSAEKAEAVRARGVQPLLGTLDDGEILAQAAQAADVVVNAASADHRGAIESLLGVLAGSGKPFIHTSGSSIVGTRAQGRRSDAIFDEDTPVTPSPARLARVALNAFILSHRDKGCRPVIICPSLIYGPGLGAGPDSVQVPLLISLAKKRGNAAHAGPGENVWSNVHIDDLVTLYALAIEKAPAGAFYFAESGENSMREACEAINRMLGFAGPPTAMSMAEAAAEWGEGTTEDTMASNSRVRAKRARQLGWQPNARGLIEEIERGVTGSSAVDPIEKIVGLLTKVLRDPSSREQTVKEFERYYDGIVVRRSIRRDVLDILDELVSDLGYYVADPAKRAEDPSYYGDERLVKEVESTLRLLSQVGIVVLQEGWPTAE